MKITAVSVQNFKRISSIEIAPEADRSLILIGGKNAMGKSSLMDALTAAFGGKSALPADPVRHGSESAEIRVELDDGALVVKRTIKDGESTIELRDADGKLASPQQRLDKIIGARFLDPLAFKAMKADEQRKALLAIIDKDGAIAKLDVRRKTVFEARTEAGRDHKRLAAQLAGMPEVATSQPTDISALTAEAQSVEEQARARQAIQHRHEAAKKAAAARADRLTRLETQLADIAAQLEAEEQALADDKAAIQSAESELEANPTDDLDAVRKSLRERIAAATAHNQNIAADIAQAKRRAELATDVERHVAVVQKGTDKLAEIDKEKAAILAAAKLPVDGLDVDESGIKFRGVPLAQASGAEQLRVALALAIAASPNLRDVWVRDGALLDEDSLQTLANEAEAAGVRVWVERVGDRDPGAIIIQDGRIRETAQKVA